LVIDWLCDQVRDRNIVLAGLYCDYPARKEQSTTSILGAILKQLLERDGIPEPLRQMFRGEKRGFGGRPPQLSTLVEILKTTIASLPEVFICIDGLDECLPENRRELLELLSNIVRASPTARVFLSGRPHIRDEVKKYFTGATMIAIVPTVEDIERYLEMRLDKDPTPSAMDDNLRAEIMRVILGEISQMWVEATALTNPGFILFSLTRKYRFLLVFLSIDAVLEEVTIHQRKQKLEEITRGGGLGGAYSATLQRIQAQKGSRSRLGMEVLMWLSHSERPLNVEELCDAVGVEKGSTDLNFENIPTIKTLLGCSLGLVTVEASKCTVRPTCTVRLIHSTLQEHLSNNASLLPRPHSVIAEVCLTYLNSQYVRDISPEFERPEPPTNLLEYASCYWGAHARRGMTKSVKTLALSLLGGFEEHVSSWILLSCNAENWDWEVGLSDSTGFPGLHGIAYLGIVEIAISLLKMKEWDLGATDVGGNTAILWAARKGHAAMVRMLLTLENVTPNTPDSDGRTPLLWAAGNGHRDIVNILLERGKVTAGTADKDGRTPLLCAVVNGHEGIVKVLLDREDLTPNTVDKDGRTLLSLAAGNGHIGLVKVFFEWGDIAPNTPDKDGRTPLSWAAETGHIGVVKKFLERGDVTPDTSDKDGRTPLLYAVLNGHEGIVKVFWTVRISLPTLWTKTVEHFSRWQLEKGI